MKNDASSPGITETAPASTLSSVRKACRILKAIAGSSEARLTSIAQDTGLDKATILRLVDMLAAEGFVVRDAGSKLFGLGPEACGIGAAAIARTDIAAVARPSMLRLAAEFEDTVMVMVPSSCYAVCVGVELGSFALRANYLAAGGRRPLAVSAGSMALLATLPHAEYEAVMPTVRQLIAPYPRLNDALIDTMTRETRQRGYAMSIDLLIERVGSIGVAVVDAQQHPLFSLSIAALSERIVGRRPALVQALQREADICRQAWAVAVGEPRD
ncbi:helix-turn-helix domain-containing protein [Verticiella sediminum]|uniref:Helix-turn-helix domain-containing protein n=2 Tax=Verticiella sediminum TaxID=1247510 RepID=A0A556A8E9_9BURK|nr:helix-turn-helix domain-containing protein [Verticiella sediminum]